MNQCPYCNCKLDEESEPALGWPKWLVWLFGFAIGFDVCVVYAYWIIQSIKR